MLLIIFDAVICTYLHTESTQQADKHEYRQLGERI